MEDHGDIFMQLSQKEHIHISKYINKKVIEDLVHTNFLNIIDCKY